MNGGAGARPGPYDDEVGELSIPTSWKSAPLRLEPIPAKPASFESERWGPAATPTLPVVGPRILTEPEQRARRIFATCRWAGVVAVTEMVEGFDAAMRVVTGGPAKFLPDEADWASINETAKIAIAYIEGTAP